MTKKTLAILVAFGALLAASALAGQRLEGWFDYEHCAYCRAWAAQPGLVAHSHDEAHELSDGIVWVTTIDNGYEDAFAKALKAEDSVTAELNAGKDLPLCRYCATIGDLAHEGARIEAVPCHSALVTIYSSADTSVVRQLREFGVTGTAKIAQANAGYLSRHQSAH
jgi:hypothetical protein